jgi:hypothetical protein
MRTHQFGFVTTVYGGDLHHPVKGPLNTARLQFSLNGARAAQAAQIPYLMVLGDEYKQRDYLTNAFHSFGARVILQHQPMTEESMLVSRQQALRGGLESIQCNDWRNAFWSEPEKIEELVNGADNLARLRQGFLAVDEGVCDAITVYAPEMNNYPSFQRSTELAASALIAEAAGVMDYDAYRGPVGGNERMIKLMLTHPREYGIRHTVTCVMQQLRAIYSGLNVGCVHLPGFQYPWLQRYLEEMNPDIEAIRLVQSRLTEHALRFIADMKAANGGVWLPSGRIFLLN